MRACFKCRPSQVAMRARRLKILATCSYGRIGSACDVESLFVFPNIGVCARHFRERDVDG